MDTSVFFEHVRSRYGFIKRCRGPYLYTSKEVRLLDLHQEGGRAILGWRSGKSMQVFKNTLERGLWGSYPGVSSNRLQRALAALFGQCKAEQYKYFFCYLQKPSISVSQIISEEVPLLYPWSGFSPDGLETSSSSFYFIPPFPFPSMLLGASVTADGLPPSDPLSASVVEALTRSIYDLMESFETRTEQGWSSFDDSLSPYFSRKGSALYSTLGKKDYDEFVLHCLDCGILLQPDPDYPCFVPYDAKPGSFRAMDKNKLSSEVD